jgi:hypothetical protein
MHLVHVPLQTADFAIFIRWAILGVLGQNPLFGASARTVISKAENSEWLAFIRSIPSVWGRSWCARPITRRTLKLLQDQLLSYFSTTITPSGD